MVEKVHGAGGVSESCDTCLMEGGDEDAGGNADAFFWVVGFLLVSIWASGFVFLENNDECRRCCEEGFFGIRAKFGEVVEPSLRSSLLVERSFFFFGGFSNLFFNVGTGDNGEVPGLKVGSVGCGAGGANGVLKNAVGDGLRRELSYGATSFEEKVKVLSFFLGFFCGERR